jgi:hypothetical protein
MRALPKNIHGAARMVATLWPLQLSLQATSMGVGARIRKLGTIGSRCQRRKPITGPVHSEALVLAAVPLCGSSVKQAVAGSGMEHFMPTHHPCLGSDRDQPYSARGGRQFVNRKAGCFTVRPTRNRDVPAIPPRRLSARLPRSAHQPIDQDPLRDPQTQPRRITGRDWPDKPTNRQNGWRSVGRRAGLRAACR